MGLSFKELETMILKIYDKATLSDLRTIKAYISNLIEEKEKRGSAINPNDTGNRTS